MKENEILTFIRFFTHKKTLTSLQRTRFEKLVARDYSRLQLPVTIEDSDSEITSNTTTPINPSEENSRVKTLKEVRRTHHPDITADFLALFRNPTGLKFLTHDFDPGSEMLLQDVTDNALKILNERKGLPASLYSLFKNFLSGPEWKDYIGEKNTVFLTSPKVTQWATRQPGTHPIVSNEFGDTIQRFRSTVRIHNTFLPKVIDLALKQAKVCNELSIERVNLEKADFYTNVFVLNRYILQPVFRDIAQRDPEAHVEISYSRQTAHQYRTGIIKITHLGSVASPFEEVRQKLEKDGGALSNLLSSCNGYCDWTIEADFEGECKRWRILDIQGKPETEDLSSKEIRGFTHLFTFYRS